MQPFRKNVKDMREVLSLFSAAKFEEIETLFNELSARERIGLWLEVTKLWLPKQREIEVEEIEAGGRALPFDYGILTDKQLHVMYQRTKEIESMSEQDYQKLVEDARNDAEQQEQPVISNLEYTEIKNPSKKPF